ncbi:MAG: hypothetical protein PVS3B3_11790 [Ktedonobacteraceae bacterium]
MNKQVISLIFVVLVLAVLAGVYVVDGTQVYLRYQQTNTAKQKQCGDQAYVHICVLVPKTVFSAYYPSYLAAQPQNTLFTIEYSSRTPITLFIHVTIDEFSQTQSKSVNATAMVQSEYFLPPLLNQGRVLDTLTHDVNMALHVQVADANKHPYYDSDVAFALHSRRLMQWKQENRLLIAAWVTPGDPAIEELIQKAQGYLQNQPAPVPAGMIGYKGASAQQVRDEVDALYDALRLSYHITYMQESVPYSGTSDSNAVENIKLPKEILQQRSGMCIELTTLLASAVESIGLHPEIVIVPGHAFLGVAVTEDNTNMQYWDAVDLNNNVGADSANIAANTSYIKYNAQHAVLDRILISDARASGVGPML